jgi:hypothetical protein
LSAPGHPDAVDVLRRCASTPEFHHAIADVRDLRGVLSGIAFDITDVYLAR